jgi:hypothetical protein|tara:strand:- start:1118 stop:1384 length:267 start_codon:yes stop_codon:yes gene_type:complete
MTRDEINEFCETVVPSEAVVVPDGLDDAFIGVALDEDPTRAVYSIEKCIEILSKEMKPDEAEEYFWVNVAGSRGEGYPIFISTPEETY